MPRAHTARPSLEALESRTCLSVTTTLADGGHTLRLAGGAGADDVRVAQDDHRNELVVTWTSDGRRGERRFRSSQITDVVVDLRDGNDRFTYTLNGGKLTRAKEVRVGLGAGNDIALFDLAGDVVVHQARSASRPAAPTPASLRADVRIDVTGGAGDDAVDALFGHLTAQADVGFRADLGSGDDRGNVSLFGDVGARSRMALDLGGSLGDDVLSVSAVGADVAEGAALDVAQRGGDGRDVLELDHAGRLAGVLSAWAHGGAGNDVVSAGVTTTWDSAGRVSLRGFGGAGDDSLRLRHTPTPPPPNVRFVAPWVSRVRFDGLADGGPGRDTASVSPQVKVVACETVRTTRARTA